MIGKDQPGSINEIKLSRLLRYTVIDVILTYSIAALFYTDPFQFWRHAFSELGTTVTLTGNPNLVSSVIVTCGMFICGRLLLETARLYQNNPGYTRHRAKSRLLFTASLGAFISLAPNNLFHTIHTIGSAMMIGGIFLYIILLLWEEPDQKSRQRNWLAGLVCLSILGYAVTYFAGWEIKQAAQKVCLINLLFLLYRRANHPISDTTVSHPIITMVC